MSPSLDEIQEAINTCAKNVLAVSKTLPPWAVDTTIGSFWSMLSRDMDIVKSALLLKGTVDNTKKIVNTYMETYNSFSFLWLESLNDQYERFVANGPAMEDFEAKVRLRTAFSFVVPWRACSMVHIVCMFASSLACRVLACVCSM